MLQAPRTWPRRLSSLQFSELPAVRHVDEGY